VCDGGSFSLQARAGWNQLPPDYSVRRVRRSRFIIFHIFYVVLHCKFGMRADGPSAAKRLSESLPHWARIHSLHQPEVGTEKNRSQIRKLNL